MKTKAFSTLAVFALSAMSASATYYWANGGFNAKIWYPNADGSGTAQTIDYTGGTSVIDKADTATATQTNIGVSTVNLAEWNDQGTNANMWNLYVATNNTVITVADMNKSNAATLRIRSSQSTSGHTFTSTGSLNFSGGAFQLGTDSNFAGGSVGYAFYSANINELNMTQTASATFSLSKSATVGTVNMNGGKSAFCQGTQLVGDTNALDLQIATVNGGAETADATENTLYTNAVTATIGALNLKDSAKGMIGNYVSSGTLNITNLNVTSDFKSGNAFTLSGTSAYNIQNLTSTSFGEMGGRLGLQSQVTVANAIHTGTGTRIAGSDSYDFIVAGSNATLNLQNVTVNSEAKIGYGSFMSNKQDNLNIINATNATVNAGELWFLANAVNQGESGLFKASGSGTSMVVMSNDANLDGSLVAENGGKIIVRRQGGTAVESVNNVRIISSTAEGSLFQLSSDSTYVIQSASVNNITFKHNDTSASTIASTAGLYSSAGEVGAETMVVNSVNADQYAYGNVRVAQNTKIGSVTMADSSSLAFLNVGAALNTITVTNNIENAGMWLNVGSNTVLNVKADFVNTSAALDINVNSAGSFVVDGTFVNNGVANLSAGVVAGSSNAMTFGGLASDYSSDKLETNRTYLSYTGGTTNLTLNGAGTYIYTNRIHTFGKAENPSERSARLNIIKTGSGTQYFASDYIYYQGVTTVREGALYVCANGLNNNAAWGIGEIVLEGGIFGACGAATSSTEVAAIGTVKATDFTWASAATVAADLSADGTSDLIVLSGNFKKDSGDVAGDKYTFSFSGNMKENAQYALVQWADMSIVDFASTDFKFTSSNPEIDGVFTIKDNTLYFGAIPEPSSYAALFGVLSLTFVVYRRRR